MNDITVELSVTSIRSRGSNGGAIFAGKDANGRRFVAVCDYKVIPKTISPQKGESWKISGILELHPIEINGLVSFEHQIMATSADMIRPLGTHLINWISNSDECKGIGHVKAKNLYDRFGTNLIPESVTSSSPASITA